MSDNPIQNITFPSNGGSAHGYLALPPSGSGPGVVVIQEWWGLTGHIKDVTDRFAAEGFVALAPDLFGGATTHDADEAGRLMGELPVEQAARDLGGADRLPARPRGGDLLDGRAPSASAWAAASCWCWPRSRATRSARRCRSTACSRRTTRTSPGSPRRCSATSASSDDYAGPDAVAALAERIEAESGVTPQFHQYPAGHAFFNDENNLGTYDKEQADLAWQRTLEFLRAHLG